nr:MAG TPA: hypothetical protein [Crassvirales sp.]
MQHIILTCLPAMGILLCGTLLCIVIREMNNQ